MSTHDDPLEQAFRALRRLGDGDPAHVPPPWFLQKEQQTMRGQMTISKTILAALVTGSFTVGAAAAAGLYHVMGRTVARVTIDGAEHEVELDENLRGELVTSDGQVRQVQARPVVTVDASPAPIVPAPSAPEGH